MKQPIQILKEEWIKEYGEKNWENWLREMSGTTAIVVKAMEKYSIQPEHHYNIAIGLEQELSELKKENKELDNTVEAQEDKIILLEAELSALKLLSEIKEAYVEIGSKDLGEIFNYDSAKTKGWIWSDDKGWLKKISLPQ